MKVCGRQAAVAVNAPTERERLIGQLPLMSKDWRQQQRSSCCGMLHHVGWSYWIASIAVRSMFGDDQQWEDHADARGLVHSFEYLLMVIIAGLCRCYRHASGPCDSRRVWCWHASAGVIAAHLEALESLHATRRWMPAVLWSFADCNYRIMRWRICLLSATYFGFANDAQPATFA